MLSDVVDPGVNEREPARELEEGEIPSDEDDDILEGGEKASQSFDKRSLVTPTKVPNAYSEYRRHTPQYTEPHFWSVEQHPVIEDFSMDTSVYGRKESSAERKGRKRPVDLDDPTSPTFFDCSYSQSIESALNRSTSSKRISYPVCKFFRQGFCRNGDLCHLSHDVRDSPCKPELCAFYKQGYCRRGLLCKFLHGEYPCKAFHKGECSKDPCPYSHKPLNDFSKELLDKLLAKETQNTPKPEVPLLPISMRTPIKFGLPPPAAKESPVKFERNPEVVFKLGGSASSSHENLQDVGGDSLEGLVDEAASMVNIRGESSSSAFNINDMLTQFLNGGGSGEAETEAEASVTHDAESPASPDETKRKKSAAEETAEGAERELKKKSSPDLLKGYGYVNESKSAAAMEANAFEENLRRAAEVSNAREYPEPLVAPYQPPLYAPVAPFPVYSSPNGYFFEPVLEVAPFPEGDAQDVDDRPYCQPQVAMYSRIPMDQADRRYSAPAKKRRTLLQRPDFPLMPVNSPYAYREDCQQQHDRSPYASSSGSRRTLLPPASPTTACLSEGRVVVVVAAYRATAINADNSVSTLSRREGVAPGEEGDEEEEADGSRR